VTSPGEEGSPERPICILAEAPANHEMKAKRPLVGPSGEIFNDCLHAAGIARHQCYILNIWPFQIYKDKQENFVCNNRVLYTHRHGFTDDGLEAARGQMEKLHACRSNIVIGLGRPALTVLSGDHKKPIMKWRGSPLWSEKFDRKYIPTIHPAATLHGVYVWRYLIQTDFAKAALEMDKPHLELPHRELLVSPGLGDVRSFMADCKEAGRFATDIEVMNHQVSCFSMAFRKDLALTVPFVNKEGAPYWDEDDEALIWKWYAELMGDEEVMKVNQNIIGFDTPFLFSQNNIHTKGPIGDTMIAQHILYPHFKKGLDFIASYHTREPYWKDDGKIWKRIDIPWEVFQRYCGKDSAVALEAWDILSAELTQGGFWPTYNMTAEMVDALTYMSVCGLPVDKDGLERTKVELEQTIAERQASLDEITGGLNVSSPKQCREYFYGKLGIKPYISAAGGISTDDKTMSRIARRAIKGSREAKLVQEIRSLRKLKGTYIDVQLDSDNRLRCSWNPRGTWTGRLSSSKTIFGTGMNLQNLHPSFKGFIVGGDQ